MSTVVILSAVIATLIIILLFVTFSWLDKKKELKEAEDKAEKYLDLANRGNALLNKLKDASDSVIDNLQSGLELSKKRGAQLEKVVKLKEKTNQSLLESIKQSASFIEELQGRHTEEQNELMIQVQEKQARYDALYHNFSFLLNALAEHRTKNTFFARNTLLAAELQTLVYDYTQSVITVGIPDEVIDKAYFQHNGVGGVLIKPRPESQKTK